MPQESELFLNSPVAIILFWQLLLTMGNIMNNSNVSAFKIAFVTKVRKATEHRRFVLK